SSPPDVVDRCTDPGEGSAVTAAVPPVVFLEMSWPRTGIRHPTTRARFRGADLAAGGAEEGRSRGDLRRSSHGTKTVAERVLGPVDQLGLVSQGRLRAGSGAAAESRARLAHDHRGEQGAARQRPARPAAPAGDGLSPAEL